MPTSQTSASQELRLGASLSSRSTRSIMEAAVGRIQPWAPARLTQPTLPAFESPLSGELRKQASGEAGQDSAHIYAFLRPPENFAKKLTAISLGTFCCEEDSEKASTIRNAWSCCLSLLYQILSNVKMWLTPFFRLQQGKKFYCHLENESVALGGTKPSKSFSLPLFKYTFF